MTLQWTLKHIPQTTESHSFKRWVSQHLWYDIFEYLPHARMRSRGKAMLSCLCVCPQKNIEKCFKQGRKGVYRHHSQRKTISIIILGRFCTWYKSRRFFMPLFQLLPIISFVAPPLSKIARASYGQQHNSYSHTRKYRSGNVRRGARGKYSMNTL